MIDERIVKAWEDIMRVLDDHKISKSEALILSDMLYGIISSQKSSKDSSNINKSIFFKPDNGFDSIPYLKVRWGLDPCLIEDDN